MFLLNKVGYFILFMLLCSALSLRSLSSRLRLKSSIKSFTLNTNNGAIIAIDYSGSTYGSSYYWGRIHSLLEEHKSAKVEVYQLKIKFNKTNYIKYFILGYVLEY